MKHTWTQKPSEVKEGDYFFNGTAYTTSGVMAQFSLEDILYIIADVQKAAKDNNGIDYLQVYTNQSGERIWIIDQLPNEALAECDPKWVAEHHFFTVLLPEEY